MGLFVCFVGLFGFSDLYFTFMLFDLGWFLHLIDWLFCLFGLLFVFVLILFVLRVFFGY